jgi:isocitrate dehydrogenase kinase/phosphatase
VLHRRHYHNEFIFWRPAVATEHLEGETPSYACYYPLVDGLRQTLRKIATSFDLTNPWENPRRDLRNIVHALRQQFPRPVRAHPDLQIQVLRSLFFRNKGAYVIGRIINGHQEVPFAVPMLQNERGELYADTLLMGEDQLLVLFSFARAYFFVEMEAPAAFVSFLRWLMPKKPRAELYMAVGLAKQGKTLFYRDLHYHLKHSTDRFVVAPGIKGMVMLVFTLPSFPYVFKVIRDRFAPPKEIDRETVMAKYLMVKLHDRVGRMADTLEYSLVALPLERFEAGLVDELKRECGSMIEFDGDELVIGHVYIERRMQPLNLYVEECKHGGDDDSLRTALREYGQAIKELAGAGIFPGDMLLKNFGVTPRAATRRSSQPSLTGASASTTSSRSNSMPSWSPSHARATSSTSTTAICSTRVSGTRSRRWCAPASRRTSSPTPRKYASLGHLPPLSEPQPALDDAVDDPHRVRHQHQIAHQHQEQHPASHTPQQAPPEGADLPAKVRFEP